MNLIPFSIYDFFGCFVPGFLLLVAGDYAFGSGDLLQADLGITKGLFIATVAYISGHLLANLSGFLLERLVVRGFLKSPEELLFQPRQAIVGALLFPGYYDPLPSDMQKRVLAKASQQWNIAEAGRALFFLCYAAVKGDQATRDRLNTFLYLYGFCRNLSIACLVSAAALFLAAGLGPYLGLHPPINAWWWGAAGVFAAIGLFYRYLKFFRDFTVEVFRSYAALP
jgi:hypothetical protein